MKAEHNRHIKCEKWNVTSAMWKNGMWQMECDKCIVKNKMWQLDVTNVLCQMLCKKYNQKG